MMLKIEKGKALLVDGPARVNLLSGKASVFGASVKPKAQIVIRKGKRVPFEFPVDSRIELALGNSAYYETIEGNAIPFSWKKAANEILSYKKNSVILVLGGVDSGKTGLCTYIANSLLTSKRKLAFIDGDLGQSDVGPPGTVSLSFVNEPVFDFFKFPSDEMRFIGATSPRGRVALILDAVVSLKRIALEMKADFIIINTDGWVEGDGAVDYKVRLVKALAPDIVLAIQRKNELSPVLKAIDAFKVLTIESPVNIRNRDRETRRLLRESAYKKYLKEPKVRSFPLSWIKIEGNLKLNSDSEPLLKNKVEKMLGKRVLYCEDTPKCIVLVFRKDVDLEDEQKKKLESHLGKRVVVLRQGDETGLLVALENAQGKILGIGTICDVDFDRRTIRINTPVEGPISGIKIGKIKLNSEGHEIGLIFEDLELR